MYDSVSVPEIPVTATHAAGYVGGKWPTYANGSLRQHLPHATLVSVAVSAALNADALDVETGDASISEAAGWVKRQKSRGLARPIVYTSLSEAQNLINALAKAGIGRSQYRLWTAHYTGVAHRCSSKCGLGFSSVADATQYTDKALGKNLDASLCSASFFK